MTKLEEEGDKCWIYWLRYLVTCEYSLICRTICLFFAYLAQKVCYLLSYFLNKGERYSFKSFRMKSCIASLYPVPTSYEPLLLSGSDYILLVRSGYSTRWAKEWTALVQQCDGGLSTTKQLSFEAFFFQWLNSLLKCLYYTYQESH